MPKSELERAAKVKPRTWKRWARVFASTGEISSTLHPTRFEAEEDAQSSVHKSEVVLVRVTEIVHKQEER